MTIIEKKKTDLTHEFFYPKEIETFIKLYIMLPFSFLPPGHIKFLKLDKVPISRTSTLKGGREAKFIFPFL